MSRTRLPLLLALSCAACSGGGVDHLATAVIGPDGGQLRVTDGPLAGTLVKVPPGAFSDDVSLTVDQGTPTPVEFHAPVGPAAVIGPAGLQFAPSATVTLPFSPDNYLNGVIPADAIRVLVQETPQSEVQILRPLGFNSTGSAIFSLTATGVAWVAVETGSPPVTVVDYLPLDVEASLVFEDGNTVDVVSTTTEPNLIGVTIGRLTWDDGAEKVGLYLRRNGIGQILWYGQFDVTGDWQLISTQPGTMLRAEMTIGEVVKSFFPYEWYQRFGAPAPNFFGNSDLTTRLERDRPVTTPLGTFTDVIEISVENDYGSGVAGSTFRFWLARGVGIVQYQIGLEPLAGLLRGTIGGQVIVPR